MKLTLVLSLLLVGRACIAQPTPVTLGDVQVFDGTNVVTLDSTQTITGQKNFTNTTAFANVTISGSLGVVGPFTVSGNGPHSIAGTLNIPTGATLNLNNGSSILLTEGATITFNNGGSHQVNVAGAIWSPNSMGNWQLGKSGKELGDIWSLGTVRANALTLTGASPTITVPGGVTGAINVGSGATQNFAGGSFLVLQSGSTLSINTGATIATDAVILPTAAGHSGLGNSTYPVGNIISSGEIHANKMILDRGALQEIDMTVGGSIFQVAGTGTEINMQGLSTFVMGAGALFSLPTGVPLTGTLACTGGQNIYSLSVDHGMIMAYACH